MKEKLTPKDIEKIQAEIDHRKLVLRPQILDAVREARAQGDLSENFEYYAAKRDKNKNESRIRYLENMLKNAIVISDASKADEVGLNKAVTLYMEDDDEEETYKLVGSQEADPAKGTISEDSPFGKALLGHNEGEDITVDAPGGPVEYKILKVER